jgi:hypothetical protein
MGAFRCRDGLLGATEHTRLPLQPLQTVAPRPISGEPKIVSHGYPDLRSSTYDLRFSTAHRTAEKPA